MTVRQIYERAEGELQDASREHFTAVLYAMVTKFDIDGLSSCISRKWQVLLGLSTCISHVSLFSRAAIPASGSWQAIEMNAKTTDA